MTKMISCRRRHSWKKNVTPIMAVAEREVRNGLNILIWTILVAALYSDAKYYKIPNQLIVLGYVASFYLNIEKYGLSGAKIFIIEAIWPYLLLYLLFILGGMGSGDIKLFSVIATMVGAAMTIRTMIYAVLLAGVVAIILCIKERKIVDRKLHFSYYITAGFFMARLWEELAI